MFFNEFLLCIHALVAVLLVFFAFRLGKSALVSYLSVCGVLANLFIFKQIDLFGLHVTATDVFMIAQLVALNLLQEIHGAEEARKAINVSFFAALCTSLFGLFHIAYQPNAFDTTHLLYSSLLTPIPRIIFASLGIDYVAAHIERMVFSFLSLRFNKRFFAARNIVTMAISQLFDTVVFSFAGLYGLVASVPHIIVTSLGIKIVLIVGMSLLSSSAYTYFLKK